MKYVNPIFTPPSSDEGDRMQDRAASDRETLIAWTYYNMIRNIFSTGFVTREALHVL